MVNFHILVFYETFWNFTCDETITIISIKFEAYLKTYIEVTKYVIVNIFTIYIYLIRN